LEVISFVVRKWISAQSFFPSSQGRPLLPFGGNLLDEFRDFLEIFGAENAM
jgi:hypothetical protein